MRSYSLEMLKSVLLIVVMGAFGALGGSQGKASSTLERLERLGKVEVHRRACLHMGGKQATRSQVLGPTDDEMASIIPGTTFWVNNHMDIGRLMHISMLVELLGESYPHTLPSKGLALDRIVVQRDPCDREVCRKKRLTTWESAYKGFLAAAMAAGRREVPTYVRFNDDVQWTAQYPVTESEASTSSSQFPFTDFQTIRGTLDGGSSSSSPDTLAVKDRLCFERVVRPACANCFNNSMMPLTVAKFKSSALSLATYQLENSVFFSTQNVQTNIGPGPLFWYKVNGIDSRRQRRHLVASKAKCDKHRRDNCKGELQPRPLLITVAVQGSSRRMVPEHVQVLLGGIRQIAPKSDVRVLQHLESGNMTWATQVATMASSSVVLATQGGFENNLMYMHKGTTFIQLRGMYDGSRQASASLQSLADSFHVKRSVVVVSNIRAHNQPTFLLSRDELGAAIAAVHAALQ